ncbi:hypothetical protein FZEAL_1879 [Fusarium zealandicum]|uniref:Uncharacterized protein n=1 Tax=Fusarium zealandicum TaxID=1053134 RepID=A0A8H4XNA8_9HYPO|nr:hypothetical protein FZEAL_1879 [Fusarium zealandicum]
MYTPSLLPEQNVVETYYRKAYDLTPRTKSPDVKPQEEEIEEHDQQSHYSGDSTGPEGDAVEDHDQQSHLNDGTPLASDGELEVNEGEENDEQPHCDAESTGAYDQAYRHGDSASAPDLERPACFDASPPLDAAVATKIPSVITWPSLDMMPLYMGQYVYSIGLSSDIPTVPLEETEWLGCLTIFTYDLASLMQEGFFWTDVNVDIGKSGFKFGARLPHEPYQQGWRYARFYSLNSLAGGPQWNGYLSLYAHDFQVLKNFNLAHLGLEHVCGARAVDWERKYNYNYDSCYPDKCYNAMFGNMELEGWWPWPKAGDA